MGCGFGQVYDDGVVMRAVGIGCGWGKDSGDGGDNDAV